MKNKVLYK